MSVPIVMSCPRSLVLLSEFLDGDGRAPALELEMIGSHEVPEPYHGLLVHERDMTSTLAGFHGEGVGLQILQRRITPAEVIRHVVLRGKKSGRPIEYGAIRIVFDALDERARAEVLRGEEPLGGILNTLGINYRSCPGGFLRIRPQEEIARSLELDGAKCHEWLYGRCNCLNRGEGGIIAEVVEILPP